MTTTTATHSQELAELRSKEAAKAVGKSQPKGGGDDKQVTMTELLAAYALYKETLAKGVVTQSQTMNTLFKVQDKALVLANEQMKKMVPEMEKSAKEQHASSILSTVGTILGIIGLVCMFIPGLQPIGIACMVASGACLIAAGGLQIAAGAQEKKVAQQKGDAIKDQATSGQISTAVQGLSTQLNNTVSSKTTLEQTINAIIDSYGKAEVSAGPRQNYAQAG